MKMHQTDFSKLSLPEFRKWIQYLLDAGWHERLLSAVCFCFKEWRKASEANTNRIKVNSKLRDEIERLQLSNNRLKKGNPLQADLEVLIAPGLKSKQEMTTLEAENEELKRLNRNGLALLNHYLAENKRLSEVCCQWKKDFDELKGYCLEWREKSGKQTVANNQMWTVYKHSKAQNLELKQRLATQLVPVPDSPGMAFISYPN